MRRLILLPGLGADERMFGNLDRQGLPMLTPRHLLPKSGESLPAYARRSAEALDVRPGDMVGGCSFGSVVASAIARQLPVRALVLIGGALDADGLKPIPGEKMLLRLPPFMLRPFLRSDRVLQHVFAPEGAEIYRLARAMMNDAPDDLLLHGGRMLLAYRPAEPVGCPVLAIHGGRDPVMEPPPVAGCRIVPEGGHGLVWTHADEVAAFLRRGWAECQPSGAENPLSQSPPVPR